MCDTLAVVGPDRTLFAKNSDRPVGEVQLVESHGRRPGGAPLRTQYLEIEDAPGGTAAVVGSRPEWLWGFEHGVNEHRVAVGNEKVWTVDDPRQADPALIGMDLVRLGLERGRTAADAVDVITSLLERHGQGGVADQTAGEAYFSSFLVADPRDAWIVETSGARWAAEPVTAAGGGAISNRIALPAFDAVRAPGVPTGHADRRLALTKACVARGAAVTPADLARTVRDHGGEAFPSPEADAVTGAGVSVCMHLRGYQTTAASMLCELPADPAEPLRAWVALGSPCVSVYVPVFPPEGVPPEMAEPDAWHRFDALRQKVEADPALLPEVRAVLDPVEEGLWDEAEVTGTAGDPWPRIQAALDRLP